MGLLFKLFEGMYKISTPNSHAQGFNILTQVEANLLKMFEGDDRNPFFEAVYMTFFAYYSH